MSARRPPRGRSGEGDTQRPAGAATDRGQAHTLEGVVAGLILLSAVVFALEMTAVTPLSASTSSQHIENQQESTARGVLASAAETGALERALLSWNASSEQFYNTSRLGYFTSDAPPNEFGRMLNRSFNRGGVAYNVYLRYQGAGGAPDTRQYVYQGRPSDNSVQATWTLALAENDEIHDYEEAPTGTEISDEPTFFAPPASDSSVYNVVRVEVVVWRI
ncbi:DUF7288 family protein [Halosimplex salinum]|uniref:DUF7288 family protein n=1 Tax=Halosimplex salinum TaxID=1710538 RepID=UPI001F1E7D48|nr:hypothetical protein [Halosimplex salinum]